MIHILVVNLNNVQYTINLIKDLSKQSHYFMLDVVDNNSEEEDTQSILTDLNKYYKFKFVPLRDRIDLNVLWNFHYLYSPCDYLCFLNNDIRISSNFMADTYKIFYLEPRVGCVVHVTNNKQYNEATKLDYEISNEEFVQGWDFTIRREAFSLIPNDLKVFGGDDFLFQNMYNNGWKVAVALSSPVIHYKAKSRKYYDGDRKTETENWLKHKTREMKKYCKYSLPYPTFEKIEEMK